MDVTSPSRIVDRIAIHFPYLYFSWRCGMLGLTFVALGAWAFTGFNIAEGAVPLIAIQWSTFAMFCFFFWLLMANYQTGGLRSFSDIKRALVQDLTFLGRVTRYPKELLFFSKDRTIIDSYPKEAVLDGVRAFIVSLLVCMGVLFLFESIWVPLYDYLQFGSITWPVYYAIVEGGPPVFMRNMILGILPFLLIPILFAVTFDASPTHLRKRFIVKWRFDSGFAYVVIIVLSFWIAWITFPHQITPISQISNLDTALSNCYIFPAQGLFPQNTYTFYPCDIYEKAYPMSQIHSFFNPDPWVHLINVLTKVATFAAVCYPMMGFIRRNT